MAAGGAALLAGKLLSNVIGVSRRTASVGRWSC